MRTLWLVPVHALALAFAAPARAQTGGVARDGLSGDTLALHLIVDLVAVMVVVGHGTMYGSMLASGAPVRETLESGMGVWPTVALTTAVGSAALALGTLGLVDGEQDARTISVVSTTAGSLALACAALDLTLHLSSRESVPVVPVVFDWGGGFGAGIRGRF